jgi:ABC-type nitrate/sulfonate/bicarbonate transport system ATPase subunit
MNRSMCSIGRRGICCRTSCYAWQTHRKAVLFVWHGIEEAIDLADRIVVLSPHLSRIVRDIRVSSARRRDERLKTGASFLEIRHAIGSPLKHGMTATHIHRGSGSDSDGR